MRFCLQAFYTALGVGPNLCCALFFRLALCSLQFYGVKVEKTQSCFCMLPHVLLGGLKHPSYAAQQHHRCVQLIFNINT